jgi:hypothetical protein
MTARASSRCWQRLLLVLLAARPGVHNDDDVYYCTLTNDQARPRVDTDVPLRIFSHILHRQRQLGRLGAIGWVFVDVADDHRHRRQLAVTAQDHLEPIHGGT